MSDTLTSAEDPIQPPSRRGVDHAIGVAKIVLSLIPFASAAPVAFDEFVGSPYQRELHRFCQVVAETLNALLREQPHLTPESLRRNDLLSTAIGEAATIVTSPHGAEKIQLLANVIRNVAQAPVPERDVQTKLLRLVGELTPTHITILTVLSEVQRVDRPPRGVRYSKDTNNASARFYALASSTLNRPACPIRCA